MPTRSRSAGGRAFHSRRFAVAQCIEQRDQVVRIVVAVPEPIDPQVLVVADDVGLGPPTGSSARARRSSARSRPGVRCTRRPTTPSARVGCGAGRRPRGRARGVERPSPPGRPPDRRHRGGRGAGAGTPRGSGQGRSQRRTWVGWCPTRRQTDRPSDPDSHRASPCDTDPQPSRSRLGAEAAVPGALRSAP